MSGKTAIWNLLSQHPLTTSSWRKLLPYTITPGSPSPAPPAHLPPPPPSKSCGRKKKLCLRGSFQARAEDYELTECRCAMLSLGRTSVKHRSSIQTFFFPPPSFKLHNLGLKKTNKTEAAVGQKVRLRRKELRQRIQITPFDSFFFLKE